MNLSIELLDFLFKVCICTTLFLLIHDQRKLSKRIEEQKTALKQLDKELDNSKD